MANNENVNKVEYGGQTVIDITDTTADTDDVIAGEVFYAKSGARSVGTLGDATQSTHGLMSVNDKIKLDAIDTSLFAPKASPTFTGTLSLGRTANSIIGTNSIALGSDVTAEGNASIAVGASNTTYNNLSYAGGYQSIAGNVLSHVYGYGLVSTYMSQFVIGIYNHYTLPDAWVSGTTYDEGDFVAYKYGYYTCKTPNSDTEWDMSKWSATASDLFTIGGGQSDANRKNLLNVNASGNLSLSGNVYVGCNNDSSGGSKLATETYVSTAIGNISTMTGATSNANGTAGLVPAPTSSDVGKFLSADGTWGDGGKPMVILSYGNSTWNDFITAYNNNVIVYCRASSNSNPKTGTQGRMAFMAYVGFDNSGNPKDVEFQYYRSVSSHSATQMGDQVFIYKLTNAGAWSVTTREASPKEIKAGTNEKIGVSWSDNVVTLSNTMTADDMPMSSSDATTTKAAIDAKAPAHTHPFARSGVMNNNTSVSFNTSIQPGAFFFWYAYQPNGIFIGSDASAQVIFGQNVGITLSKTDNIVTITNVVGWWIPYCFMA